MRILLLLLLVGLPMTFVFTQISDNESSNHLDKMIQAGIRDWQVPGLAVVVVRDNDVVFKEVYGVKNLDDSSAVDEHTLFAMASTTKAIVAIALGMLVDEGKLNWTDKVTQHLPNFRLSDPYITSDARVVDLLTHNLGMANADIIWGADSSSAQEALDRFAHVKTVYPLRGGFVYQNFGYALAGKVIEHISGMPWSTFVQERIVEPLEMHRTQTISSHILNIGNYTKPYDIENEKLIDIDFNFSDQVGAAGFIWSSINDVSNYMQFLLNEGIYNGDTLIQKETFQYLFKPHAFVTDAQFYPTQKLTQPNWKTYGLGWFQQDYLGHKLDFHTGSLGGLVALAAIMHDKNVAVYVFANRDHAELRHAIMYKAMDLFAFGNDDTPWHQNTWELYQNIKKGTQQQEEQFMAARAVHTKPSFSLQSYAGTYYNEVAGTVKVDIAHDLLELDFNDFIQLRAEHWHYDVFRTLKEGQNRFRALLDFHINVLGKIDALNILGYEFKKTH